MCAANVKDVDIDLFTVSFLTQEGRHGVALIFNEAEVDRRLALLTKAYGEDSPIVKELQEWHTARRQANRVLEIGTPRNEENGEGGSK